MTSRVFRSIAALLSVVFLASAPVHAELIPLSHVVQIVGHDQNAPQLRLRTGTQLREAPVSGLNRSTQEPAAANHPADRESAATAAAAKNGPAASNPPDSVLSGVNLSAHEPRSPISVIDEGELEGTICDCGEIAAAVGSFPKWPLLFLGAVPFFFIHDCDQCGTVMSFPPSSEPPISTQTPPQMPESNSLILLGLGLVVLAGVFRRHNRTTRTVVAARRTKASV